MAVIKVDSGHLMREPASSKVDLRLPSVPFYVVLTAKLATLKLTCHPHPSPQTQNIKFCQNWLFGVVFITPSDNEDSQQKLLQDEAIRDSNIDQSSQTGKFEHRPTAV